MKVKDVLIMAARIIDDAETEKFIESGIALNIEVAKENADKLLNAYNFVNADLACEYEKLIIKEKFENFSEISVSQLKEIPREIVCFTDEKGYEVKYEVMGGKIISDRVIDTAIITYSYVPKERGFEDDTDYKELNRITPRAIALGTAAEYLFNAGAYTGAAETGKKFKEVVSACLRTSGKKVIPRRSWYL